MTGLRCELIFSGELSARFGQVFDGLAMTSSDGTTTVRGIIRDQSEFQGLIRQGADLGLDLVSASAVPEPESSRGAEG